MLKSSRITALIVALAVGTAVAPSTLWSQTINVSLSPSTATVSLGQTFRFAAKVTPTSMSGVTWNVNGILGGNATVGTISSSGLYTAPAALPSPASVTVSVISTADSSKSANATVTLVSTAPPTISVSLSPSSASLQVSQTQQFTATVSGSSNTSVTWSVNGVTGGDSTNGTISTSGLYTAPATVPPSTITVTATSVADSSQSAQAAVTVIDPTLTLSPSATTVPTSQGVQFSVVQTASAQGGGSQKQTTYTWNVNGVKGGNSVVGTISNKGLYTAPGGVPSPATTTITATNSSNQSGQATATVVLAVSVALSPASASVVVSQTQQFTATVSGSSNTSVTWSTNAGTISSSGLYTAPSTVPSGAVTVTATSVADTTKSAQASVTVTSALTITTTALPGGDVGNAYSATLAASGGTTPYTWSILSGMIPPGTGLTTTTGTISGTPTSSGTYTVTVQVTDAVGHQISATPSIVVAAPLTITTASLPGGTVGVAYSATLTATGGASPYSWSVTSGTLPAGVTLSTAGALSGTPTNSGAYTFGIQVVDSIGVTASQSYNLTITHSHSVSLNWTASTSTNVIGYNVYRATQAGDPYTLLTSPPVAQTTYTDTAVQAGQTYYYVATAVDNNNNESPYSNQAQAVVPSP